ncbi:MAG: PKD domain-containing protein [Bacteroidetes bacterium]|nr:PKD domain-containing protein [Bacteroidota bacterium]
MKKITTILKLQAKPNFKAFLMLVCLFFFFGNAKSICNLNAGFNYTVGANGVVNFASTSTGTAVTTNHQWFFYQGSSFGQTTTHSYSNNGTYPVTLYLSDSLCTDSITKYITINNLSCNLNANFNYTVSPNGVVHFASNTTGVGPFANYYWYFGDSNVGSGPTITHTYSTSGIYQVNLHVYDSLCSDSMVITINTNLISGLKNNNSAITSVKVYPNPNNGEFIINLSNVDLNKTTGVLIYNSLGQVIYKDEEFCKSDISKKINLEEIPNGVYFLKIDNGKENKVSRIIIQNK